MSGHSKWKNIQHKKEKSDAAKGKVFTKIGREIILAVREGGPNPEANSKLRDIIAKAKANNVPNDNIERVIKKAASSGEGDQYEHITYEGYGPAGVAVIVETLTDNRNRTAGDVRHYFDKFGGNLGQTGSVNWMFTEKGVIVIDKEEYSEDSIMNDILDTDAQDYVTEEEVYEIYTDPKDFTSVCEALQAKGYEFVSADVSQVPSNYITLTDEEQIQNMEKLLEHLEDNDDVQNVWHNWDEE